MKTFKVIIHESDESSEERTIVADRFSLYAHGEHTSIAFYVRTPRTYKNWRGKEITVYDEANIYDAEFFHTSVVVEPVNV